MASNLIIFFHVGQTSLMEMEWFFVCSKISQKKLKFLNYFSSEIAKKSHFRSVFFLIDKQFKITASTSQSPKISQKNYNF